MKTTDKFKRFEERFEEELYATPGTMFIDNIRDATPEERRSVNEHIEKISKPTGYYFGDIFEEEFNEEKCKHEECPYKGCSYHKCTTNKITSTPLWDELPVYMPRSQEAMKDCMSYLDI